MRKWWEWIERPLVWTPRPIWVNLPWPILSLRIRESEILTTRFYIFIEKTEVTGRKIVVQSKYQIQIKTRIKTYGNFSLTVTLWLWAIFKKGRKFNQNWIFYQNFNFMPSLFFWKFKNLEIEFLRAIEFTLWIPFFETIYGSWGVNKIFKDGISRLELAWK